MAYFVSTLANCAGLVVTQSSPKEGEFCALNFMAKDLFGKALMSQNTASIENELAWHALNGAGLDYICPDWLDRTRNPALMHWLAGSSKTRPLVAKQLRADFQLEPLSGGGGAEFPMNVLQQGPEFVRKLALFVGYVGFSQVVRKSIDGRFKRAFWKLVGEQGYLFISKRAAFYNPGLIVRFTPRLQTGGSISETEILVVGLSVLRAVMTATGPATARRLNLMFPVGVLESLRQQTDIAVDSKELSILNRVVLKLFSELGVSAS